MLIKKRKKFNYDASVEFLLTEYRYACSDAKHHDDMQVSFLKFAFSFYTAFLATMVALYQNYDGSIVLQLAMLLTAGFAIGVIFLMIMVRNRVNYIKSLMQTINLRKFFMENMQINFLPYNRLSVKPEVVKNFKFQSVYTHSMFALVFFNCVLLAGAFMMLHRYFTTHNFGRIDLVICLAFFFLIFVIQIYATVAYLHDQEKPSSAEATKNKKEIKINNF